MNTAAYTLTFQVRNGQRIEQPEPIAGVDITLVNGELTVLRPDSSIPVIMLNKVFDTRVSALGIYFKGVELLGDRVSYHELWCAYERMSPHAPYVTGSAPRLKFETVDFAVVSYKEVEKVLSWFFGGAEDQAGFIARMDADQGWGNDTVHRFKVEPESAWVQPNHRDALAAVRERGHVVWNWELAAILNEAGRAGLLPLGPVLIEVCW